MRLQATRTSVTSAGGSGDALYRAAGGRPTLDQRFAKDKSLVDKVSGQTLITFTRASAGTYVDSNGIIQTAANNEARFDHDPATGESLGLLIEEARTNLLLNSSGDSNLTYWGRSNASRSVVDGPGGTNSAYQYLSVGGTVTTKLSSANTNGVSLTVGQQYALSCYVKGVDYDIVSFGGGADGFNSGNTRCRFKLSTETVQDTTNSVESARVIPAGNGWYRLEVVTIAATSADTLFLFLDLGNTGDESHTTDEGFQAYGFQVEEGTFASSYISTTNAQVTRGPDNPVINTNLSSWYNQSSGTFVTTSSAVTNLQTNALRGIFFIYQANLAGSTFRHYLLYRGGGNDQFFLATRFNTASAFVNVSPGDPTYSKDTTAYGYSSSEISKLFYDGSFLTGSASVLNWATYTADRLFIGGATKLNGHISRFTYFPTKRTDQELIKVSGGDTAIPIITYGITNTGSTFNLRSADTVNYAVDWDSTGGYETSTSNTLAHTYAAGDYTLVVYSDDPYRPYFNNVTADVEQITSVVISAGANLGTSLNGSFRGGEFITSFECPFEATSNVINMSNSFRNAHALTSFPLIDTSGCTSFINTWNSCTNLTSFPLINTSNALSFANAWQNCDGLVSFPQLNFSSSTRFKAAWMNSNNLANFPANMYDTTGTFTQDAFKSCWQSCALTAQSIENILVSLDTNGQSNIELHIGGGTNAAKTTWSTAANTAYTNLVNKGWTITFTA